VLQSCKTSVVAQIGASNVGDRPLFLVVAAKILSTPFDSSLSDASGAVEVVLFFVLTVFERQLKS
jgi:hypothetical protein